MIADLRFALRLLRQSPVFACVAVVSLALTIGANTALFSVINTLLLKSLPYKDADRLVYVSEFWPHEPVVPGPPQPDFANWRAESKLLDGIAAYSGVSESLNLTGVGEPERIQRTLVTAGLLELIGTRLALGRNITQDEDRAGGPAAVILGYALWQRKFGASPDVIGKAIRLDRTERVVVGVLPSGFAFPDNNFKADLLVPEGIADRDGRWNSQNFRLVRVLARLKPGATISSLKDELTSILRAHSAEEPAQFVTMRKDMEVRITPLRDWLTAAVRPLVLVLQASVAVLLFVACLNVAALQLTRAASREQEILIRRALGAPPRRLIRQLLTESALLIAAGGVLGAALGYLSTGLLRTFLPANLHLADTVRVDAVVLWFTAGVAALTALLAGLAPALFAMNQAAPSRSPGRSQHRVHGALVVTEIAAAMVLLVSAALLIRTFVRLVDQNPGFHPDGVLTIKVSLPILPQDPYPQPQKWTAFFGQVLDKVRAIPGVESAAISAGLPLVGAHALAGISFQGRPEPPLGGRPEAPVAGVTTDYFHVLGIPVLRGRAFTPADNSGPRVAIVNRAFAEHFFPGEDALGKRIEFGSREGLWREIVGIAGDVKQQGRRRLDAFVAYAPFSQFADFEAYVMAKSSRIPPEQLTRAVTAAIHAVDPNQPVYDVATMEERLGIALAPQRTNMSLMSGFAALALVLATMGIFGVTAYFVRRRVREIGIRMALGAIPGDVLRMVLARGLRLAALGIALGLAGALGLTRYLGSLLSDVPAADPLALASAAVLFAFVAAAACLIPARQAARVDPAVALRQE
jgi:putative ABC transport system permease protein